MHFVEKLWGTMFGMRHRGSPTGPVILVYHRIGKPGRDPWKLSVSPRKFEGHLNAISNVTVPVSLSRMCRALSEGTLDPRWVAVTFDDGYEDNLCVAAPLLSKYGIPATVFVTTGQLESNRYFWWDELEEIVYGAGGYRAGSSRFFTESRNSLYHRLWRELSGLDHGRRNRRIEELREVLEPSSESHTPYSTMTRAQLKVLASYDGISIGAHTVSHPNLPDLPKDEQRREVVTCRRAIESVLGEPPEYFSYPHGAFSDVTLDEVRKAGYDNAVGLSGEPVTTKADPMSVPRIMVGNWSAPRFTAWLKRLTGN